MKKTITTLISLILLPVYLFTQDSALQEDLMYDLYDRGYDEIYRNKDSAYYYLGRALKIASKISDHNTELDILSYMVIASDYNYDIKNYNAFLEQTKNLLEQDTITSKIENLKVYQDLYLENKANYYYKTNEMVKAKAIYLNLRSQYVDFPVDSLSIREAQSLFSINNFLATIYKHLGRYELSGQFYLKNRRLVEEADSLAGFNSVYLNTINHLTAQLFGQMGKYEKANELQTKVLDYYKTKYAEDVKYKNNLVSAYQKTTMTLIEQDSLEKALSNLDESQEYLLKDDPFYKEALILYGYIYTKLNDGQKAIQNYQHALDEYKEYRQHKPHQDIAEVYLKIAEFHLRDKNHSEGLETLQKALNSAGRNIQISNAQLNPEPNEVFSKRQLLQLLDIKLQLLQIAHTKTNDEKYINAAINTNKDILGTFDLLKKEFESKLDKQFLAETAYPIFHRMLAITYEAFKENSTSDLFELALNISEKNKDFLLLEALRNANATQYGNVPNEIIEKEAQLRTGVSDLERNLFDANEGESDFSEDLFKLKQEYFGFLDTLESKYPKYHDLKYQSKNLNLSTLGSSLEDNEVLISFTMTENHLFALVLDDDSQDFVKLPFDESDREKVRDFYRILSKPAITDNSTAISESGKLFFEKILQRPLLNFENENLTIIPDDVLHYLPFDLLVEDDELLLQSKFIGYGNSISSYLELKEKGEGDVEKLLAFAPGFDDQIVESEIRFEFGKLLYNDDEVEKIGNVFETEIYVDNNATLQNFKDKAPEFSLIHLATHASANDEYPDYSYLAFSKNEGGSNILYIKDLYNTTLNADMVTLSACQTGIGKLQKGQGMMSLSKGFFYAGAKSLVNTLWKINDKSSVKLMEYFYESLSEGKNKKEALRNAKLKYLETTEDNLLRHPYYWSAFVVSGDIAPITRTYFWWYFVLGAALLVLFVAFIYFKRKRKTTLT